MSAIGETRERDFGSDVLTRSTAHLRLVDVPHCGWTDLGTLARLASWLSRHREASFWREHHVPRLANGNGLGGPIGPA